MQPLPPYRLPQQLETAVQRVRMAARSAAERTVDTLGLAALSSTQVYQRDALLGAQYELNRKLAIFALTFNETLDASVTREAAPDTGSSALAHDRTGTNWDTLELVDDHEVELHISADRFALEIAHACEWEIRELDGYMGSLLARGLNEPDRNPLRAQAIGQALIRAVDAVAERADTRKVLGTEIGRALAQALRQTYADIVADLRAGGVKPVGLTLRQPARSTRGRDATTTLATDDDAHDSDNESTRRSWHDDSGAGRLGTRHGRGGDRSGWDGLRDLPGAGAHGSRRGASAGSRGDTSGGGGYPSHSNARARAQLSLGQVDPVMMSLIRRLSDAPSADDGDFDDAEGFAGGHATPGGAWSQPTLPRGPALAADGTALIAPNLIHAHRDELRRAARSGIDQMVIDVVATLFDQILSDAKVPPQMARLIARLQLPVLRAALGDPAFFSARRHPVRRLINRIASLGAAVDDFDSTEGQALLARVQSLVQQIVDGDFEQIEIYAETLAALEKFVAAQALEGLQAEGDADAVLARKEAQIRVEQRFAQDLDGALAALPMADYLREFLAQVWSRVIAAAENEHGRDSARARRMREVGRELVLSVLPKGAPTQRKAFLQQLPQLMKDLNAGMDRVRWSDESRRTFFAKLLPAHAESLKVQPVSTLEHNLLAKRVDGALATPLPQPAELPSAAETPSPDGLEQPGAPVVFTPAEAQAVGLVDENSVDWRTELDIDLGAEPEVTVAELSIEGLPAPEPVEPAQGKSLADHVQIGFAYQMHLEGEWRKVRLAHVSAGRTFFVFTHGAKQRKTVSMTHRMLVRLCESARLRAFESAYLIERATARARRQLAALARPAAAQTPS